MELHDRRLADSGWMQRALELSRKCTPASNAYSVGVVVVDRQGRELAWGYSRESDRTIHGEEATLQKVDPADPRLSGATLYSTMEPCSHRRSRPRSCTDLILASGVSRVVIAWREPSLFVADCQGVELLSAAGVAVTELSELAEAAQAANAHLQR
jgi:diaminohydroxyphosphoribosylaminopyrimidine deaminase/5-amino-6-(5-phosphoribosylamino)uracil reductase